jgi:hypothetical protein
MTKSICNDDNNNNKNNNSNNAIIKNLRHILYILIEATQEKRTKNAHTHTHAHCETVIEGLKTGNIGNYQ